MSLNGLVQPWPEKCASLNWNWIRAHQLAPQGLGPIMDPTIKCNYGEYAPYIYPQQSLKIAQPFRVWGYPNVTQCSTLAPLLYKHRVNTLNNSRQCNL